MRHAAVARDSARAFRGTRKAVFWILLSVVILVVIAYLGIGGVAASQLTLPKRVFDPGLNPGLYNLQYDDLRIPARNDQLEIAAWYIPSEENQRAIILVHGRDNSRSNGLVDHFVDLAKALHEAGFSVLMIDLRGHGQSADSRYYFGIKEHQDVLGGLDWLVSNGYQPGRIGVLGYSLGAASVVAAAAEEEAIGAIWIDSAYADIASVIEGSWVKESGLPQMFWPATRLMTRILYGYDIAASRPIEEIGKVAPRPIFMAHCAQDPVIPISHMDRLLAVAQNTQTWIIPSCDQHTLGENIVPDKNNNHALGYNLQPDEYTQKVIGFFDESLK